MRAKKSFGQHFLRDQSVIAAIVAAARPEDAALVVEVGPGEGALTQELVKEERRLVLVEADRDLIAPLEEHFPSAHVVHADAAAVDYRSFLSTPWLLIGNLPYNAANAIIMHALRVVPPPLRMVVMVQKEVGERILGLPHARGLFTVAVQLYADVEKVCTVKPGAFVPPPKVDSMVLVITPHRTPPVDAENVIHLAKIGFAKRRKQLHRNIADAGVAPSDTVKAALIVLGFTPEARAQELSPVQWVALRNHLR